MIITEYYKTREDGVVLNRTYSNAGFMIEREGVRYSEAIDPAELNRQYIETDEPIDRDADPLEATEADYQNALAEFGVKG
jgi:hypothetical protein